MKTRIRLSARRTSSFRRAWGACERTAPAVLFEDHYADVELQRIFPDSKIFADATPRSPPQSRF
jgi:hypothetical protein